MALKFVNFALNFQSATFIIAEIGQNHQGSIEIAKELIKIAKESGADCVKFQKTDLKAKFNKQALNRPYLSENSWGETYGKHKEYLEFSFEEYKILQEYANSLDIFFTASAMDIKSLDFLANELKVPFIKIGSGDANNFLLIEKAAKLQIPLIISTGMQSFDTVKKIYNLVSKYHKNFAILHCLSSYPAKIEEINLKVIDLYKKTFPDIIIGYSGHELGISISLAAVSLGAKIIERHITLDKTMKGSDHKCSLDPNEFEFLIQEIRIIEAAFGKPEKKMQSSELECYKKLGKTLVYSKNLQKGDILTNNDLNVKVAEPKGLDGSDFDKVIGKKLAKDVQEDESVLETDFIG